MVAPRNFFHFGEATDRTTETNSISAPMASASSTRPDSNPRRRSATFVCC